MMIRQYRPHEAPTGSVFYWIPPGQYFPVATTREHAIKLQSRRPRPRHGGFIHIPAAWAEYPYGETLTHQQLVAHVTP